MLMLILAPATAKADAQISLTSSGQLDYGFSCGGFYFLPSLSFVCQETRGQQRYVLVIVVGGVDLC